MWKRAYDSLTFPYLLLTKSKYGNVNMEAHHIAVLYAVEVYMTLKSKKSTYEFPYVTVYMGDEIYLFSYIHARFSGLFLYILVYMWTYNLRAMLYIHFRLVELLTIRMKFSLKSLYFFISNLSKEVCVKCD